MALSSYLETRIHQLHNRIQKAADLLNEYDECLLYTTDPKARARYRSEIKSIQSSIQRYNDEYSKLKSELDHQNNGTDFAIGEVQDELQRLTVNTQRLLDGQTVIKAGQSRLNAELASVHQSLLKTYAESELHIMESIISKLNASQAELTQRLISSLNDHQLLSTTDIANMWTALEPALTKHLSEIGTINSDAVTIIQDPALDVRHRIKIGIPLVLPFISYEGEIDLGTGFNLKTAWETLRNRLLKSQETQRLAQPNSVSNLPLAAFLVSSAQSISTVELEKLPYDGALEHDHYIYGMPKSHE